MYSNKYMRLKVLVLSTAGTPLLFKHMLHDKDCFHKCFTFFLYCIFSKFAQLNSMTKQIAKRVCCPQTYRLLTPPHLLPDSRSAELSSVLFRNVMFVRASSGNVSLSCLYLSVVVCIFFCFLCSCVHLRCCVGYFGSSFLLIKK